MKLLSTLLLALLSMSSLAMTTIEGKVDFEKGRYVVADIPLVGMSLQELRQFEERNVKVEGIERDSGALEIYRISVKAQQGYKTVYDWDVVDQAYYGGGL